MSASNSNAWIILRGASGNNLKALDAAIPVGLFTCVTGVSGSGKSTLIQDTQYPRLLYELYGTRMAWAPHLALEGTDQFDKVIDIDQSPIGRTPRSNPATYTGTFDMIRELFAMTPDAKMRGYKNGRFRFNVKGGRCTSWTSQRPACTSPDDREARSRRSTVPIGTGIRKQDGRASLREDVKNLLPDGRGSRGAPPPGAPGEHDPRWSGSPLRSEIVIEHTLDVIKTADDVTDFYLGPPSTPCYSELCALHVASSP